MEDDVGAPERLPEMSSEDTPSQTREQAFLLLTEHTKNDSLVKHALSVEAAMRWYAVQRGADEHLWGLTGLLHDFDYERFPTYSLEGPEPSGHPFEGCRILRSLGYPETMIEAILGHATYSGVQRRTDLAKALFACDELCGLITASVLVRPDRSIHALELSSVKKKMKDKAFAKGVNREDIIVGSHELGVPLEQHIENVIQGMRAAAPSLGLDGR